jgi:hypothetical protein
MSRCAVMISTELQNGLMRPNHSAASAALDGMTHVGAGRAGAGTGTAFITGAGGTTRVT